MGNIRNITSSFINQESIKTLNIVVLNGLCYRTIKSHYDQTNFSVILASGTVSLSIQCAELVGPAG